MIPPGEVPPGCQPVITVHGLRNSFGEQVVHENLDLTVCRGEILGVVGGSGTGKSVLLRSIMFSPRTSISPASGVCSPMTDRSSTDLPVPDPPTTPRISPRHTVKSRSS